MRDDPALADHHRSYPDGPPVVRVDITDSDQLQAAARTQTGRPEAAIADIARFVCDFYTEHDYHTFAAQR